MSITIKKLQQIKFNNNDIRFFGRNGINYYSYLDIVKVVETSDRAKKIAHEILKEKLNSDQACTDIIEEFQSYYITATGIRFLLEELERKRKNVKGANYGIREDLIAFLESGIDDEETIEFMKVLGEDAIGQLRFTTTKPRLVAVVDVIALATGFHFVSFHRPHFRTNRPRMRSVNLISLTISPMFILL